MESPDASACIEGLPAVLASRYSSIHLSRQRELAEMLNTPENEMVALCYPTPGVREGLNELSMDMDASGFARPAVPGQSPPDLSSENHVKLIQTEDILRAMISSLDSETRNETAEADLVLAYLEDR
jgi:hypothetical protein